MPSSVDTPDLQRPAERTAPVEDTRHPNVIRFSERDINEFCRASGDRNPLHGSALYARKTPFGEPVVYGALVVIDAMRKARLADA